MANQKKKNNKTKTNKQTNKKNPTRTTNLWENLWRLYFTFQSVSYAVSQKYQFLKQILNIYSQIHSHYSGIKISKKKKQRSCWCQENTVWQYQYPGRNYSLTTNSRVPLLHPKPKCKTGIMKIQILNLVILGREGKHLPLILFHVLSALNCLERSWIWDLKVWRIY